MAAKTPLALSVNGAPHQHNGNGSLASLLRELGTGRQPVAVLVNDKVVNERSRNIYKLKAGDRIEVLTFAGGG
jgi:sulfur carrier protein